MASKAAEEQTHDEALAAVPFDSSALPVGELMENYNGEGPKPCILSFYINDIVEVNLVEERWQPSLALTVDWLDDGAMQDDGEGVFSFKDEIELAEGGAGIWRPRLDFVNKTEGVDPVDESFDVLKLAGRPVVTQYAWYIPMLRCAASDSLRQFPFDKPIVSISITSSYWSNDYLDIKIDSAVRKSLSGRKLLDFCDKTCFNNTEYVIIGMDVKERSVPFPYLARYEDSGTYPEVSVELHLMRRPWFYIWRVVVIIVVVNLMEVTSFFIGPDDLGDRFGVSGTMLLTTVAFYMVVADYLPKVSFVTRLDFFSLSQLLLLFGSAVENVLVYVLRTGTLPTPVSLANFVTEVPDTETQCAADAKECYRSMDGTTWAFVAWSEASVGLVDTGFLLLYVLGLLLTTAWFLYPLLEYQRLERRSREWVEAHEAHVLRTQQNDGEAAVQRGVWRNPARNDEPEANEAGFAPDPELHLRKCFDRSKNRDAGESCSNSTEAN